MNTQKYGIGNCGLLLEADRRMYRGRDTVSHSIIHRERTADNYNLCPHPQYTAAQVRGINEKIRGKKLAKNAIAWGGTVITLPQDYEGDTRAFFETAYDGMKNLYGLKDEDIISAYVHMDETTPHMHFYFIPVVHEETKNRASWDDVMPRWKYKKQHDILQSYMTGQLGVPVNLKNGETKGIDMQSLTQDEKRLSMQVEKLKGQTEQAQEGLVNVQIATSDAQETLAGQQAKIAQNDATIRQQKGEIKQQEKTLEQQKKLTAKQEKELEQQEAKIGKARAELQDIRNQQRELSKEVWKLERKKEFLDDKINVKSRTMEGLENDIGETKALMEDLEREKEKLLKKIDKMVKSHDGLRRTLNIARNITENQRDKIEIRRDKEEVRVEKTLKKPLSGIAALMEAEEAVERAAGIFERLKSAAKGDAEALADLEADDDFGRD